MPSEVDMISNIWKKICSYTIGCPFDKILCFDFPFNVEI